MAGEMALKSDRNLFCSASVNFELAKAVSITTVVIGHFFSSFPWAVVTVALCIFGFSPAYFTDKKYAEGVLYGYWTNKFKRLFFRVIVINLFLIFLLLIKGKQGIFSWHSIVHLFGASGFLNWFHVANKSPLGNGLWFFTLLLVFYIAYPFLRKTPPILINYYNLLLCYLLLFTMQFFYPMGHMLWVTSFSFISGIFFCRKKIKFSLIQFCVVIFPLLFCILLFKYIKIKNGNLIIISAFSVLSSVLLLNLQLKIPQFVSSFSLFINNHMVEIYFIHGYLFYRPFSSQLINFFLSVLLITIVAYLLLKASVSIQKLVLRNYENSPHTRS